MAHFSRRQFLANVGKGMMVASIGSAVALDLGLHPALADARDDSLSFGSLEPLVALMQETPLDKLLPVLVERLHSGVDLKTLVSAGALANARSFGGQDYVGYHTMMALTPAFEMSRQMPEGKAALPVLKVLYRNTAQIHSRGGKPAEVLHKIAPAELPTGSDGGQLLHQQMLARDVNAAERTLAALVQADRGQAYNDLQPLVQDDADVHRVVLAWRAWDVLRLTGPSYAETLLRQSVRYCIDSENGRVNRGTPEPSIRRLLPKLLDQYQLVGRPAGERRGDASWLEELSQTIFVGNREQAADAVAAALGEGFSFEDVGEAISLAANKLVLHDPGRAEARPGKPVGSVHGDSVGVHASDSANAWRNIARATDQRNAVASLIVGGYHTAGQFGRVEKSLFAPAELVASIATNDPQQLLGELDETVRAGEQARATAIVTKYGQLGHSEQPALDLLLGFAVSEDGALHAEKYFRTVSEEFAATRPEFRWRHLSALARVTASEFGQPAAGYADAVQLLG